MLFSPVGKMVKKKNKTLIKKETKSYEHFTIHLPYLGPAVRKNFSRYVMAPLKHAGVKISDPDKQLELWETVYGIQRVKMITTAYQELPSAKKLKKWYDAVDALHEMIQQERSTLSDHLVHLRDELSNTRYQLGKLRKRREAKRSGSSKYSPGIVSITASLIRYWNDWTTKKHHITGHGYKDEEFPETKKFKVKTDPGEYFLQNVLRVYFNHEFDNSQIKTLVKKAKKNKGIPSKITGIDYDWKKDDPLWKK